MVSGTKSRVNGWTKTRGCGGVGASMRVFGFVCVLLGREMCVVYFFSTVNRN